MFKRSCQAALYLLPLVMVSLLHGRADGQTFIQRGVPFNPLLNNASLYTFPNPTNGLPSQLPFAFVAVAHQDCRLYHNGATLMPVHRLLAGLCTDMQPAVVPASNGYIPTYASIFAMPQAGGGAGGQNGGQNIGQNIGQNLGNNLGQLFGNNIGTFGGGQPINPSQAAMMRYAAMRNASMYSQAYDLQRGYAGSNYNYAATTNYAATAPTAGFAPLPGNTAGQSNFFTAMPNTAGGFSTFGNAPNPFGAFRNAEQEEKENKEKLEGRKEEDADRPKKDKDANR